MKSIIAPVVKSFDVEITELSFRHLKSGALLRVHVDRKITHPVPLPYPGSSVDLKLLENLSKEISAAVEACGAGVGKCSLEVSSPGPDRPVAREELKFLVDHPMKVRLRMPREGRRNFTGRLVSVEESEERAAGVTSILIETQDGRHELDAAGIESARLDPGEPEEIKSRPKLKSKSKKRKKRGKKKWHGK